MELREHAATVMSTLDQSINSLSDYDNFVSYLHSIGRLHRKVPDFKREYFWKIEQPFLKAVKQTLDERCNETIEQIYMIAIKLIIETIADGYGQYDEGADANRREFDLGRGSGGGAGRAGQGDEPADDVRRPDKQPGRDSETQNVAGQQQQQQQRRQQSAGPCKWAARLSGTKGVSISENNSIRANGGPDSQDRLREEVDEKERDTLLVEATCKLMKTTSSWLDEMRDSSTDTGDQSLQRLVGHLNATLMAQGNNQDQQLKRASGREEREREVISTTTSRVNKFKAKLEEGQAATTTALPTKTTKTTTTANPSGEKAHRPKGENNLSNSTKQQIKLAGCPPSNPATHFEENDIAPASNRQIISSCPAHCRKLKPSPERTNLESNLAASQRATMSSCHDNNGPAGGVESGQPQVTRTGPCAKPADNQAQIPRDRSKLASVKLAGPGADLSKSSSRRLAFRESSPMELDVEPGHLVGGPRRWLSSAPASSLFNQNQLNAAKDQMERRCAGQRSQQNYNNKSAITTNGGHQQIQATLEGHVLGKCKQEGAELGGHEVGLATGNESNGGESRHKAHATSAALYKSEQVILKLLTSYRRQSKTDGELGEFIKVLLLINRLILALAGEPRRAGPTLDDVASLRTSSRADLTVGS